MAFAQFIRDRLRHFDIDLVRRSSYLKSSEEARRIHRLMALLNVIPGEMLRPAISALPQAKSQLGQDILALVINDFTYGNFFVEFGATDGISLSNTWLLEKVFGWKGILAEPARTWHAALAVNRNVAVEHKCVWSRSGEILTFSEVPREAELSTLTGLISEDRHAESRRNTRKYQVETITLNELLERHGAPAEIGFLSIDTEGSEYEILNALDWRKWKFRFIACEHNFTLKREMIHELLTRHGYERIYREISDFDDWYVLKDNLKLS